MVKEHRHKEKKWKEEEDGEEKKANRNCHITFVDIGKCHMNFDQLSCENQVSNVQKTLIPINKHKSPLKLHQFMVLKLFLRLFGFVFSSSKLLSTTVNVH